MSCASLHLCFGFRADIKTMSNGDTSTTDLLERLEDIEVLSVLLVYSLFSAEFLILTTCKLKIF